VDKIFVSYFNDNPEDPDYVFGPDYNAYTPDAEGLRKALAFEEIQRNKGYKTDFLLGKIVCDNRIKLLLAEKVE